MRLNHNRKNLLMKKLTLLPLLLLSLAAVCQNNEPPDSAMLKAVSPKGYWDTNIDFKKFSAIASNGMTYTQDSLKGKITFINFWSEDCASCIAQMGALNDLYEKYKNNKDFRFLSFTYETDKNVGRIVRKHHLEYPIIRMEREEINRLIFSLGLPTAIITDIAGKISFINSGGPADKTEAGKKVNTLFAKGIERILFPQ